MKPARTPQGAPRARERSTASEASGRGGGASRDGAASSATTGGVKLRALNEPSSATTGGAVKLRALNEPRPARVQADGNGIPVMVLHGKRRLRVEAVRETWRIDDEWWRRPISRIYHTVVLEDGRSTTLYQDLVQRGWFMQG